MTQQPADEPLDPQVEAIRKRLVRLLVISGGIMVLGLITVLIALAYRISGSDSNEEPQMRAVHESAAPEVMQLEVSGNRIILVIRYEDDARTVLRVQTMDGTLISETELR